MWFIFACNIRVLSRLLGFFCDNRAERERHGWARWKGVFLLEQIWYLGNSKIGNNAQKFHFFG